jgi:hypothetical protein
LVHFRERLTLRCRSGGCFVAAGDSAEGNVGGAAAASPAWSPSAAATASADAAPAAAGDADAAREGIAAAAAASADDEETDDDDDDDDDGGAEPICSRFADGPSAMLDDDHRGTSRTVDCSAAVDTTSDEAVAGANSDCDRGLDTGELEPLATTAVDGDVKTAGIGMPCAGE